MAIELIEAFAADGHVEFCAAYADVFPIKVFLTFCGLPLADAPMLLRFSNSMLRPEGTTPEEKAASMAGANKGFSITSRQRSRTGARIRARTGSATSSMPRRTAGR